MLQFCADRFCESKIESKIESKMCNILVLEKQKTSSYDMRDII